MTTELQDELAARWDEIGLDGTGERHLVVLPSMTIDIPPPLLARAAPALLTLEQRLICMLPLLLQPGTSLVYLTSATVSPMVAGYWFGLVPGLDTGEARRRLTLLSAGDPSPRARRTLAPTPSCATVSAHFVLTTVTPPPGCSSRCWSRWAVWPRN